MQHHSIIIRFGQNGIKGKRSAQLHACVLFKTCAVATVSFSSAIMVLPVLFTSVHNLQQEIIFEINYCEMRSSDMLMNLYHIDQKIAIC